MKNKIINEFNLLKNIEKSITNKRFFKTKYCLTNEEFIGIPVPQIRNIAKKYYLYISYEILDFFINSNIHEYRLFALLILIKKYNASNIKHEVINYYLKNLHNINNWDLVDLSCYKILGDYLYNYCNKDYNILLKFSKNKNFWIRRIAVVSTIYFIRKNYLEPSLIICLDLLKDKEDLIQKAVGWILREVGKKNENILLNFLKNNLKNISKTSLRYANERLKYPFV